MFDPFHYWFGLCFAIRLGRSMLWVLFTSIENEMIMPGLLVPSTVERDYSYTCVPLMEELIYLNFFKKGSNQNKSTTAAGSYRGTLINVALSRDKLIPRVTGNQWGGSLPNVTGDEGLLCSETQTCNSLIESLPCNFIAALQDEEGNAWCGVSIMYLAHSTAPW